MGWDTSQRRVTSSQWSCKTMLRLSWENAGGRSSREIARFLLTPMGGIHNPKNPHLAPPLLASALAEYPPGPPRNAIYISQLPRSFSRVGPKTLAIGPCTMEHKTRDDAADKAASPAFPGAAARAPPNQAEARPQQAHELPDCVQRHQRKEVGAPETSGG